MMDQCLPKFVSQQIKQTGGIKTGAKFSRQIRGNYNCPWMSPGLQHSRDRSTCLIITLPRRLKMIVGLLKDFVKDIFGGEIKTSTSEQLELSLGGQLSNQLYGKERSPHCCFDRIS